MEAIPVAQPIASARTTAPGSGPSAATTPASDGPWTYSVIRYGWPASTPASRMRATPNGGMLRATRASATNRSLAAASPARAQERGHHGRAVHPLGQEDVPPRRVRPGEVIHPAGEPVAADATGVAGPQ